MCEPMVGRMVQGIATFRLEPRDGGDVVLVRRMVAIRGDWLQERSEPWGRRSQPGRKLNEQRSNGTVYLSHQRKSRTSLVTSAQ